MAEYIIQDTTLTAIGDAIRAKTGGTELIVPENMPTEIESIQSGGEDWVNQITTYISLFYKREFPEGYDLVIKFNDFAQPDLSQMCAYTKNLNSVKIKGTVINNAAVNRTFKNSHVKIIDLTESSIKSSTNKAQETFFGCYNLHTIIGTIDFSKCSGFINAYSSCSELVNVEFLTNNIFYSISFAQSPLLSNESIQSIINGLATVEIAQTLTLHADVKAKLTESQIAQITSKNWTLA